MGLNITLSILFRKTFGLTRYAAFSLSLLTWFNLPNGILTLQKQGSEIIKVRDLISNHSELEKVPLFCRFLSPHFY
jgi:hypothetical protein